MIPAGQPGRLRRCPCVACVDNRWDAAIDGVPATDCPTCHGSGETWDGHRREADTGQPITGDCPDCAIYLTRKSA